MSVIVDAIGLRGPIKENSQKENTSIQQSVSGHFYISSFFNVLLLSYIVTARYGSSKTSPNSV